MFNDQIMLFDSSLQESRKTQDRPKHVEMDIRFRSEQGPRGERGGRGRGGRGRGRGRGGRGGPRSEFNNSHEKRAVS